MSLAGFIKTFVLLCSSWISSFSKKSRETEDLESSEVSTVDSNTGVGSADGKINVTTEP